jgi:hypothetical protein
MDAVPAICCIGLPHSGQLTASTPEGYGYAYYLKGRCHTPPLEAAGPLSSIALSWRDITVLTPEFALLLLAAVLILTVGVGLLLHRLGTACLTAIAFLLSCGFSPIRRQRLTGTIPVGL